MTTKRVFLDLDGVLADFDTGYMMATGRWPGVQTDSVDWNAVATRPGFYRQLPTMRDAQFLVDEVLRLGAVHDFATAILSGIPRSVPCAVTDKQAWVTDNFPYLPLITCASRDKAKHGRPGDVLIDDWPKYQRLWVAMGGVWITHTSAESSLEDLRHCLEDPTKCPSN